MRHYYYLSDYFIHTYMVALMNFTTNYLVMTGRWPAHRKVVGPHIIFLEGVKEELLPRAPAQILEFRRG